MSAKVCFSTILIAALVLSGCQNPYKEFYTNRIPPDQEWRLYPFSGTTKFISAVPREMADARAQLERRGFGVIGVASFEAVTRDYSSQLRSRAQDVGADYVLMSSAFAQTVTGSIPIINYQPGQVQTTYTQGQVNANAYGTGGNVNATANYTGTSTTVNSGTFSTTQVPYSVNRNTYEALFFRKIRYNFGARYRPLFDDERRALQRNAGLVITMIIDDSPAFRANILVGDIMVALDDEQIFSEPQFVQLASTKPGRTVKLGILRDGKPMVFDVTLGQELH